MTRQKHKYLFFTVLISILLGVIYILLEYIYYSDDFCGCSSTCEHFYLTGTSKITGYIILLISYVWIVLSLWKVKNISRWWSIPGIIIFILTFYGNSYLIYVNGVCGDEIYESHFYFNNRKTGEYISPDIFKIDSLKAGKYQGKILGFSSENNQIKLFRIDDEPILLKTDFLFWKIRKNVIIHHLQYQLNSVRQDADNYIEYIGGKGMKEEDFRHEFASNKNIYAIKKLIDKQIVQEKDGTTRFRFNLQK